MFVQEAVRIVAEPFCTEQLLHEARLQWESARERMHAESAVEPASYGNPSQRALFHSSDKADKETRCQAWAEQGLRLRDALNLYPYSVEADGACVPATFIVT